MSIRYINPDTKISPDGKTLLAADSTGGGRLWDVATGKPIGQPPTRRLTGIGQVVFSPDGKTVLIAGSEGKAHLWDLATGEAIGQALSFPDYTSLVIGHDARSILATGPLASWLCDATPSRPVGRPFPCQTTPSDVVFDSDGKRVLIADYGWSENPRRARLWDTATGRPIGRPLEAFSRLGSGALSMMAIGPDERTVLVGGWDGTARLWNTSTGRRIGSALSHQQAIGAAAFSPDGRMVLTGSVDRTARFWDATSARPIGAPLVHGAAILAVGFSPDGTVALTGGRDSTARRWDVATGQAIGAPLRCSEHVSAVAFSPDGQTVVAECTDGTLAAWDAATGKPIGDASAHLPSCWAPARGRPGRAARGGSGGSTAQPAGLAEEGLAVSRRRRPRTGRSQALSPDGQTVLALGEDQRVWMLDAATGHAIGPPLLEPDAERSQISAYFSPDGALVLIDDAGQRLFWAEEPGRLRSLRLWKVPDLPDDFARVAAWVATLTGLELDDHGESRPMGHRDWQRRRDELRALGGPRQIEQDQFLDPVISGPDPLARARAWMDRKRWAEAEVAFDDVVAAWPEFGAFWLVRARFFAARSRPDEAAASFARAFALGIRDPKSIAEIVTDDAIFDRVLALSPEHDAALRLVRAESLARRGRNAEALAAMAPIVDRQPGARERISLRLGRARLYELLGSWSRAAIEFAALANMAPDDGPGLDDLGAMQEWDVAHDLAISRLLAGDLAGYRSACATMLQRIDTPTKLQRLDPRAGGPFYIADRVVDACVSAPDAVANLTALVRAAGVVPGGDHLVGAALYRGGLYREALNRLEGSNRSSRQPARDRLFRAMIHSRLGHAGEARRLLADADRWLEEAERSTPSTQSSSNQPDWQMVMDQQMTHLLRNEAEAVIRYDPVFPADPFAH
jgi:WD40 repeat protein/tetratricopeptide (TPR) repeat protein